MRLLSDRNRGTLPALWCRHRRRCALSLSLACVDDRSLLLLLLLHSQSNLPDYPPSASVKRRFNEFLWLYDRLKEEWVSTQDRKDPVPKPVKPPPKKAIGT